MIKRLFFLSFLLILACSQSNYSQIKVTEVIDGDTIRLSNRRLLRYIGLDTPEVRIKDKGGDFKYQPQPFSLEAKEFNRKLVEGKTIRVEFDIEKTDRYGRLLGYCFLDETFVNAKLIEQGYAVLYTYPPNVKYVEFFIDAQKKAREMEKGLWGSFPIIDHSQANKYINQIRSVEGVVLGSYKSAKCVFLNFGQDYKSDFTVVIFDNVLDAFSREGIDPLSFYNRKKVRVNGKVREYNGPEIIVNSPYEIEVLEGE
ncbi:MAG: thermonuclease family protein [Candidatus Omnitrophica bacterium]|nr:thermonuclease family protein [Candidatus Omnitrophota bacterium]